MISRPLTQNESIDCEPFTFSNRSKYSWVEFRLPNGKASQGIHIKPGSYNSPAGPTCSGVWWSDALFVCDSKSGWTKVYGDYGENSSCLTSLPSPASPYIAYGHR